MSIFDRQSRINSLLQGTQGAPMGRANIVRAPTSLEQMLAQSNAQRQSASPMSAPQSPMTQRILADLAAKRVAPAQAGMATPTAAPIAAPAGGSFMDKLMMPQSQGMLNAAAAGFEASGYQDRPVSLGQVLGRMGTAGMQAYNDAEDRIAVQNAAQLKGLLTQAKIGTELGKSGQGFSGNSMTAQSFRTLLNIGPKIKSGKATEPEKAQYDLAFGYLAKPKQQKTYDDLGNETITTIPAQDLSQFPSPRGGAGTVGQETTKPSTEALKQQKYVKSVNSMAANINRYRQQLKQLTRVDMASGSMDFPTDNMSRSSAIAESLRLDIKELEELGALVGGDFQILDNLLTSPNSAKALKAGTAALLIQLDELENTVGQKLSERGATLSGTYSTPVPVSTPEEWAKVKVGQYGKLPNGQIKMKVQTQ